MISGEQFIMLRRIPISVLAEVVEYFMQDISKEAIVQIYLTDGDFRIVYPKEQEASGADIVYSFGIQKGEHVCTIHSHGTLNAFWSSVDDADEIQTTGLYGVFGNLDRRNISYKFRFCDAGKRPVPLDIWDIACK